MHYNTVESLNKGYSGISHFVLCREFVCFSFREFIVNEHLIGTLKRVFCIDYREVISIVSSSQRHFIRGSTVIIYWTIFILIGSLHSGVSNVSSRSDTSQQSHIIDELVWYYHIYL